MYQGNNSFSVYVSLSFSAFELNFDIFWLQFYKLFFTQRPHHSEINSNILFLIQAFFFTTCTVILKMFVLNVSFNKSLNFFSLKGFFKKFIFFVLFEPITMWRSSPSLNSTHSKFICWVTNSIRTSFCRVTKSY